MIWSDETSYQETWVWVVRREWSRVVEAGIRCHRDGLNFHVDVLAQGSSGNTISTTYCSALQLPLASRDL